MVRGHLKAALILLLFLGKALANQSAAPIQLLILNSYHQALPWTQAYNEGLQTAVNHSEYRFQLYFENLDAARLPSSYRTQFASYLKDKYQNIHIDAVLTDSAPTSELVLAFPDLFPYPKILYTLSAQSASDQFVFSNTQKSFVEQTLELMRAQNLRLTQFVYIGSGAPTEDTFIEIIENYVAERPNLSLRTERDFEFNALLDSVKTLPEDSAIIYETIFSDNTGRTFVPRDAVAAIAESASVPVYSTYSTFLGAGIVGGHLLDASIIGKSSVQAATDYLTTGSFAEDYPVSDTFVDITLSMVHNLKTNIAIPYVAFNQPEHWTDKHASTILWAAIGAAIFAGLTVFWLYRLRQVNKRIQATNVTLNEIQSELKIKNDELHEKSIKDPLTGLLNRRAFIPLLEQTVLEAGRYGTPAALMLIDIDNFKQLNDEFGHNTGDNTLLAFAEILQSESRRTDAIARWGGEEFVILAKGVKADEAFDYIEKIRAHVRTSLSFGAHPVTFSAGICNVNSHRTVDDIIAVADAAMYQAKDNGKDRTIVIRSEGLIA